MTDNNPKSVNQLMKYLNNNKNIVIKFSQKDKLRNIGYYHGYKGYRFIRNSSNQINYSNFNELLAIYNFDSQLKSIFYPHVMFIETALKNYVLEVIIEMSNSQSFNDIYNDVLDDYKRFSPTGENPNNGNFKKALKRRLDLRTKINKIQADSYGKDNNMVSHYLSQDRIIPIWGIFELLSLGEFGFFVSCMNNQSRTEISNKLNIRQSDNTDAMLPQRYINIVKDFRNAIAHNDVVFDTRFRTANIAQQVKSALSNATNINDINFESITDYLILIIYLLKALNTSKTDMKMLITEFEELAEKLVKKIPFQIFSQILYTNYKSKIEKLRKYISQ